MHLRSYSKRQRLLLSVPSAVLFRKKEEELYSSPFSVSVFPSSAFLFHPLIELLLAV
ncbi:hypothetical protein CLOM621_05509 [Clostridium sp. M62/1]|nr:hypothetical protein CLOM621_05509 [Clostridium sp. M62/1]